MKKYYLFTLVISLAMILCSCTQSADTSSDSDYSAVTKGQSTVQDDESAKNILQVALGSKDHSTLVAAVQAAELEDVHVEEDSDTYLLEYCTPPEELETLGPRGVRVSLASQSVEFVPRF